MPDGARVVGANRAGARTGIVRVRDRRAAGVSARMVPETMPIVASEMVVESPAAPALRLASAPALVEVQAP